MDEQNQFLNSYKKKLNDQQQEPDRAESAPENAPSPLRYEDKSDFVPTPQAERTGPPSARIRPERVVAIVVVALVILGLATGLILYLGRGTAAIDLTGWTVSDAQLWASDNNVKLQVEEQYNDQFDEGKIISQNPAKGSLVKKGGFIKIMVSLGHDLTVTLPLPDLKNMTKTEIEAWAEQNFMTKVRITTEYNDEVPAGQVISFEVNDSTVVDEVKRSSPIYIIVSKGPDEQTAVLVTVPNFKEMTVPQSYQFADENGITLKIAEDYDDYAPSGSIIAQSEKADTKVNKGSEIILTVSKGKKILLPDFSASSKEQASAVAASLGITVTISEEYSSQSLGAFLSQSLAAGSVYQSGTVLELAYSLGNKIIVPSFVGQTRDSIETWAKGLNDQGARIVISATSTQSNSPKGQIIYQSPAGKSISTSSTIRITISLGKAVFVPDFVGPSDAGYDQAITRDEALAMCEALNIVPIFVEASKTGRLPGEIWSQSIAAGSEVYENSTITLKYCPVNITITVPDFSGMTQAEIIAAGYLKKLDMTFAIASYPVEGFSGQVFEQSLPAGSVAAAGSKINLTISPAP